MTDPRRAASEVDPVPATPSDAGAVPWPAGAPDPARRQAAGTEIAVATGVMVVVAVLGVMLGVLWHAVTPGAEILMTGDGPVHADSSSEAYFADDAWFAVLGAVSGVLAAIGCWFLARRYRGAAVLVGLVAGCLLAAVVAWQVGRHIGLGEFRQLIEHAEPGSRIRRPPTLSAFGVLGVQGFTAAFMYTLLAGWSRYPGLHRHGTGDAHPGADRPEVF